MGPWGGEIANSSIRYAPPDQQPPTRMRPGRATLGALFIDAGGNQAAIIEGTPAALVLALRDALAVAEQGVTHGDLMAEQVRRSRASGCTWCPTCASERIGGRITAAGLSCAACDSVLVRKPVAA